MQKELTYLSIPDHIKRLAKMAAAGCGITLSELVACALLNECAKLGVKSIDLISDSNAVKEASDD